MEQITGHKKIRATISKLLDANEKSEAVVVGVNGEKRMLIISELGLYRLLFRSNLPHAKEFTKYVGSVILPTIRKTGQFNVNNEISKTNKSIKKRFELVNKLETYKKERIYINKKIANVNFELSEIDKDMFAIAVPNFEHTQLQLSI